MMRSAGTRGLAAVWTTLLLWAGLGLCTSTAGGQDSTQQVIRPPAGSLLEEPFKRFDSTLESLRAEKHLPGLSVAVVKDQRIVFARGYGHSDAADRRATTLRTSYWIASVTKTFTAAVIMKLVEQHRLDLDMKVSAVPQWGDFCAELARSGLIFAGAQLPNLTIPPVDCGAPITIRQVLSHTVNGVPGERFIYNPVVYSELASIVHAVTGEDFAALLERFILNPARMTDTMTSYYDQRRSYVLTNLAQPRRLTDDGRLVNSPNPRWDLGGGAGIISTALDLAKFDIALDRGRIVSPESRHRMFEPARSTAGVPLPYGLGWYVQEYDGLKLVWHSGWEPPAYSALILKVPEKGMTLVALANSEGLWWDNPLTEAQVQNSPFARAFLALVGPGR